MSNALRGDRDAVVFCHGRLRWYCRVGQGRWKETRLRSGATGMNLKVTLYEICGFLLPGTVFLVGFVILFWSLFHPCIPLTLGGFTRDAWVFIILASYFLGHLAQALANCTIGRHPQKEDLFLTQGRAESIPDALLQRATSKIAEMFGVAPEEVSREFLYRICDEIVAQGGNREDREIYQYREGFYRGLTIPLVMLGFSLFMRAAIKGASLNLSGVVWPIGRAELCTLALMSFAGSWLSFLRYRRFARYSVTQAVIGFLAYALDKGLSATRKREEES